MSSPKKSSSHRKSYSGGSSRRDHRERDSGFGSLRDQESIMANPDRGFTAQDYGTQSGSVYALQEALSAANAEVELLKAKCHEAHADIAAKNKELREQKGSWQGLYDRCEVLEDLTTKQDTEIQSLREENGVLREALKHMRHRSSPGIPEAPLYMSGAAGREMPPSPPLVRTMSTNKKSSSKEKEKEKDKEREKSKEKEKSRHEKDTKKRLSSRFELSDEQQQSIPIPPHSSSQSRYIESWGPGGRPTRPRSSSVSAPSKRASVSFPAGYTPNYTTTQEPVFAPARQPTFSQVPRNYSTRQAPEVADPYRYREDGSYQAYPLPGEQRHRGRRP